MANSLVVSQATLQGVGMKEARTRVARVVRRTENRSAILCPVDTGLLRSTRKSSIATRGAFIVGQVVYTANYAAAVHEGRRAVTIRPKKANGRLRFEVGGKVVYARVVHQPARPGRPFLSEALREVSAQEGFRYRRIRR